jgi:predicted ester cyclase
MAHSDALVQDVFRAIEARDFDAVAGRLTPDCDFRAPGVALQGPEGVVAWMQPFLDAFPDLHHHIGPVVASGDGVAFELELHGTHTEPLATPQGELPGTGRELHLAVCNMWRVTDDGAIAAYHIYFDQVAFMVALGLVPEEGA